MSDAGELESLLAAKMPIVAIESHEEAKVEKEMRRTRPLSVVMAEKVASLRAWARERAVPAD